MVDQVGAHVLATIDRFLPQSRGDRDGQQVLWLDVECLGLLASSMSNKLDCAKALAMFLTVAWLALI